jgi:cation:H+ antiporter
MVTDVVLLVIGAAAVWLGAKGMILGAVKLAKHLGIPSLVVGFTVVAFGTSAPELVVSAIAAAKGQAEIALGNVIGSNILNIGLVLGLAALIAPIRVQAEVLRRDIPIVIAATLLLVALAWWGGRIGRIDGALLLSCFAAHIVMSYGIAKREQARVTKTPGWERPALKPTHIVFLLGGTVVLAGGAEAMVRGAVGVAEGLGMSKRIIGMTIVAFGTSVPELAATMVAARQGESDLALGNVVGSNVYNITLILGAAALISPIPSPIDTALVDFAFFVIFTLMLAPMGRIGWRISRLDGLLIVLTFLCFNAFLIFFS